MTNIIRILLVDDEPPCRDALRAFIASGYPTAMVVGEASSLAEAKSLIKTVVPDVVLLDLALEDGTGFDLLDHFPKPAFRVIFITGFDNFALRAFRYSAVDYLLKPVDPAELMEAISRAVEPSDIQLRHRQLDQLRHTTTTREFDRITLNTSDGLVFIRTEEIMRLEAKGNYLICLDPSTTQHGRSIPNPLEVNHVNVLHPKNGHFQPPKVELSSAGA